MTMTWTLTRRADYLPRALVAATPQMLERAQHAVRTGMYPEPEEIQALALFHEEHAILAEELERAKVLLDELFRAGKIGRDQLRFVMYGEGQ